jgi:hypothetical protein
MGWPQAYQNEWQQFCLPGISGLDQGFLFIMQSRIQKGLV